MPWPVPGLSVVGAVWSVVVVLEPGSGGSVASSHGLSLRGRGVRGTLLPVCGGRSSCGVCVIVVLLAALWWVMVAMVLCRGESGVVDDAGVGLSVGPDPPGWRCGAAMLAASPYLSAEVFGVAQDGVMRLTVHGCGCLVMGWRGCG